MIIINLDKTEGAKSKPQPKAVAIVKPQNIAPRSDGNLSDKIKQLEDDLAAVRKKRNILSTRTARVVDEVVKRLRAESPALAQAFMRGELPDEQVKEHYAKLQACQDEMIALFDKIRHLEQYGTMPVHAPPANSLVKIFDTPETAMLRSEIRRLDDLIHKNIKKIEQANHGIKAPVNSARIAEWKVKVALAEARRTDCKAKLKHIQHEQRINVAH